MWNMAERNEALSVKAVLILESDDQVAGLAAARFAGLGTRVVRIARTAPEARTMLQSGRFDFAMLDVVSTGIEMESVVQELERQDIPFVFSAEGLGGAGGGTPDERRFAWVRIVAKPYTDIDLIGAMDAALAGQDLTLTL